MKNNRIFFITTLLSVLLYIAFLFFVDNYYKFNEQREVKKHAKIVSNSLWSFNPDLAKDYLQFACKVRKYKKLVVVFSSNKEFISIDYGQFNPVDLFLKSLSLISVVSIKSEIIHKGKVIGEISVEWYNTAIYTYLYVLIVILLLLTIFWFFLNTLKHKYELEDRVRKRTADLENEIEERKQAEEERKKLQAQLIQAQKMEAIGTLAGGIAHNFNNILMGIQGRASLMMVDKDPSHPDYEHLNGVEESVRMATELTRDLLGFARGGKYEVKPTDLNTLIRHENSMFGCTKKEIQFHGKYANDLWAVEVDRGQIQQILLNLYINAWQAMPGGGDLYIQTENVTLDEVDLRPSEVTPGRYVKISVTDTGTGMDEETRQRIFDPFFSTRGTGRGTGLGLPSVYGIIKNHRGFIDVYSEKGEGSTFNIYLPASEKEAVKEGPGTDRYEIQYEKGTVLLVDDEGMVIDVGQRMLERLGYQVLIARSGKEALDVYGKKIKEIDLVILDMIMPSMGGGETYDRLKGIDENVRVLLSSGYSINGQARKIMDRGCNGFIQKPFSLNDLSIKVKEALGETR